MHYFYYKNYLITQCACNREVKIPSLPKIRDACSIFSVYLVIILELEDWYFRPVIIILMFINSIYVVRVFYCSHCSWMLIPVVWASIWGKKVEENTSLSHLSGFCQKRMNENVTLMSIFFFLLFPWTLCFFDQSLLCRWYFKIETVYFLGNHLLSK